jgi:hypothetical protein
MEHYTVYRTYTVAVSESTEIQADNQRHAIELTQEGDKMGLIAWKCRSQSMLDLHYKAKQL